MRVLGIETSCDETASALLEDGRILADAVHTQELHAAYGGVVPEIASRAHLQKMDRLCRALLDRCDVELAGIDLIAVTDGPGLAGSLLVGISFALGLHANLGTPLTGVNHLEGHIASVMLEPPIPEFPFLALVVSGGHTAIYRVENFGSYECLGETVDDAAGEAFDKVGKLLGFPYPAGRTIEERARLHGNNGLLKFPVAQLKTDRIDFSFSGLKTAVKYYIEQKNSEGVELDIPLVCDSFQEAVIRSLLRNVETAATRTGLTRLALVGGVACNGALRERLGKSFGHGFYTPRRSLCTDNAVMIAKAGMENHTRGLARRPRLAPSAGLQSSRELRTNTQNEAGNLPDN